MNAIGTIVSNLASSIGGMLMMGFVALLFFGLLALSLAPGAGVGLIVDPIIGQLQFLLIDRSGWLVFVSGAVLYFLPQGIKDSGRAFLATKPGKIATIVSLAGAAYWVAGLQGAIYASVGALAFILFSGSGIVDAVAKRAPAFLEWINRNRREYILNGNREAYAKAVFDPAKYPELYKSIPEDLRRGLDMDGRLADGRHVTWLAYRHFNDEILQQAVRESGANAKRLALFTFAGLVLMAIFTPTYGSGDLVHFYPAWAEEAGAWLPIAAYWTGIYINQVLASAGTILFAALAAALLFPAAWYFGFWNAKKAWWERAQYALSLTTRDAAVIWSDRLVDRRLDNLSYNRAVDDATGPLANSPLIPIGIASGAHRAKGDSRSFLRDQLAAQDLWSVWAHMAIFGGTGSGKTVDGLIPRIRRITKGFRAAGMPIGFLVLDGKGTLWSKKAIIDAFADRDDVRVIGVREGHYAFDLLAGMTPQQVAQTFENVAGQLEGEPTADFWLKSASNVLQRAAAMARVLPDDFLGGLRSYTLLGLDKLARNQDIRLQANDVIADLVDAGGGIDKCSDELKEAFEAALWFRGEGWDGMAEATKTGIMANFGVVLDKVTAVNDASRMFFRGDVPKDRLVNIMHAAEGGVLMNSMGEAEYGAAGKIITVWIKERLYNEGMRRLAVADAAKKAGQTAPEVTSVAVIMDEAQALLTQTEKEVFAQSREAGMFLNMATQSISSIISVLGEQDANTLLQLMTTQLFLKTTDKATTDYAIQRAGSFPHAYTAEQNLYATQAARDEAVPDHTPAFRPVGMLSSLLPSIPSFNLKGMADAIQYDDRFVQNTQPNSGSDGGASAAAWRHEDKNREALIQNLQLKPILDTGALSRGQGLAFACVERGGVIRCDIIDIKGLRLQEEAEIAAAAAQKEAA